MTTIKLRIGREVRPEPWRLARQSTGLCYECGRGPARVWTARVLLCGVCWHQAQVAADLMARQDGRRRRVRP